ncbi:MAG: NAD(P)H-hydrate dehydratase [Ignavibacteriaceae bacterium]|nr:NAD(P)H-hydrate dehydratase [Ignavibacteriaceae bacterium]
MKNVFFNREVLNAESEIVKQSGIPSCILMENAGLRASLIISDYFRKNSLEDIFILCGKGNNAGDGFVIARHLAINGFKVNLIMLYQSTHLKGDAALNYNLINSLNLDINKFDYFSENDSLPSVENSLIVDAIFGIGFRGSPDNHVKKIISHINSIKSKFVCAIDIPSCLDRYNTDNPVLKCDVTISMGVYKFDTLFEKGKIYSGEIKVVEIGTGSEVFSQFNREKIFRSEFIDISKNIKVRDKLSNKYDTGKLLIIAGSAGYTGAARLCTLSAMRMGSGAVIVAFPDEVNEIMCSILTEPVKLSVDISSQKDVDSVMEKIKWADAVLIGSGCGISDYTKKLLDLVLANAEVPVVVDGDALRYINMNNLRSSPAKLILTPHIGEFARILNCTSDAVKKNFYSLSKGFAGMNNVIVTLKCSTTIITNGDSFVINSTGSENLSTFGSGDVLAGIITSLVSRGENPFTSAVAGTYLHGYCSDLLVDKFGSSSMVASDLLEVIPEVKKKFNL